MPSHTPKYTTERKEGKMKKTPTKAEISRAVAPLRGTVTKIGANEVVRAAGWPLKYTDAARDEWERQKAVRVARLDLRKRCAGRYPRPERVIAPWTLSMDERLRRRVERLVPRIMRSGAAGGTTYFVWLTIDPRDVGYDVSISENRETYRGRYRGWSAKEDHHAVTVPRAWISRVERRGIGVLDGLLTLDASPLDCDVAGVDLYAATWARQARGYDVATERGYIARADGYSYHGETPQKALDGLRRKRSSVPRGTPSNIDGLAKKHGDVFVSLDAVRGVGACEYGIRAWVARTNFEREFTAGGCTIARLAEGYRSCPATEARAAALRAVRIAGEGLER